MLNSLPPKAADMKQTREQIYAIYPEIEIVLRDIEDTVKQYFVETASSALDRYERDLGLEPASSLEDAQRRERILAAIISGGTCTVKMLKDTIMRVGGRAVTVTEDAENYTVKISFTDVYGIPRYIDDIKAAVQRIIPAHLTVEYEYMYKLLMEYFDFTVEEMHSSTLNGLGGI